MVSSWVVTTSFAFLILTVASFRAVIFPAKWSSMSSIRYIPFSTKVAGDGLVSMVWSSVCFCSHFAAEVVLDCLVVFRRILQKGLANNKQDHYCHGETHKRFWFTLQRTPHIRFMTPHTIYAFARYCINSISTIVIFQSILALFTFLFE